MEKQLFEAPCKYCGQIIDIMAFDETDAIEKASNDCECCGAEKEKKRKTLNNYLDLLCGSEADKFNPVVPEVFQTLKNVIDLVLDEVINKATFNVDGTAITISLSSEKIKINRKKTESRGGEV